MGAFTREIITFRNKQFSWLKEQSSYTNGEIMALPIQG